jgi:hypothetical protein
MISSLYKDCVLKLDFKNHKGRPGHVGGSLPRSAGTFAKESSGGISKFFGRGDRLLKSAVEEFGLTRDPRQAGFLLPSGDLLSLGNKGASRTGHYMIAYDALKKIGLGKRNIKDLLSHFSRATGAVRIGAYNTDIGMSLLVPRQLTSRQAEWIISQAKNIYQGEIYFDVGNRATPKIVHFTLPFERSKLAAFVRSLLSKRLSEINKLYYSALYNLKDISNDLFSL